MSTLELTLSIGGLAKTLEDVQRLRSGLARRKRLHERIATQAGGMTRAYVTRLNRHRTANELGATPTGHHSRAARAIESDSSDTVSVIRLPRATGLGRAFGDVVIRPGSGKKFLTIPADKRTYGRRAREFAPGELVFSVVGGRFPALMFKRGWTVAYWLARVVTQKQDRSLLPSDELYLRVASGEAQKWVRDILSGKEGVA